MEIDIRMELEEFIKLPTGYLFRDVVYRDDDIRMTPRKKVRWADALVTIREIPNENKGIRIPCR
jgi:hypothetical protein